MQKKMLAEAEKRIEILQKMGLWEEVRNVWEKNTTCSDSIIHIALQR